MLDTEVLTRGARPVPGTDDPLWWRSAVIYQLYVRSFADGNGDGTGDLAGVRARLGYLKDLGVDAIWFNPWYPSPLADGGYDVQDYRDIDPRFGSLQEAEQLIEEALALGIRTIIDVVPNHISDQHPWFQAALAAGPGSPERERFWFHPGRGADGSGIPTDWVSSFQGETWTRTTNPDGTPGEWYLHLFTPEQPDLNWNHPDVRREHEDILRFWFDRGVAGVRIDSAALPVKDPALPQLEGNAPAPGAHPHVDRDELHDIYRAWRRVADEYDGTRVLVGEVWLDDAERFARYLRHDEMHTAFNFDFMTQPWNAAAMRASVERTLAEHAPVGAPATWVLSNHDITRPVTRYGRADSGFSFARKRFGTPTDIARGTRRARAAALLTAALPGSLYIYQGDELGLPEAELPRDVIQDPMHFRSGGVDPGRDGCRVPLPWSGNRPPYGFGTAAGTRTWLPQPADWGALAAETQEADPASMLSLYRAALRLRRTLDDLRADELHWLELGADVLAFRRGERTLSVTNLGATPVPLPAHRAVLLASASPAGDEGGGILPPDSTVWLAL
ncbi:glycoside hydrolase family 13 protein [Microbacterium sp. M3]|uniref:Glycoside hydrolase family 13 protein n=1 Tax=Microbacterium arthrosphaerae TaxID=792652 RepID=A0ABU4GZW8_9MICO|nr:MULTISPECIES: glycoside hydrolase family 13 protein [Microbacterium]MDW4571985.1 glycoside hydrolase family 13 protein [Microbacterium arthrosphaerae]MDW7605840.1 glycoside hydrolase family 13 protein [Microbacterium sp. M3]